MSLVISDDILKASGLSERELLLEIVLMLFRQDKISLGKASELMGMHRMQFQKLLADRDICIHYDVAEFQEDLKTFSSQPICHNAPCCFLALTRKPSHSGALWGRR